MFCLELLSQDPSCCLLIGLAGITNMRATKLTTAPQGFEYYRVCDQEGVCRVVRGMWAAQHLVEDTPDLSATRTRLYPAEWS